jgi:hypothetical protein
LQTRFEGEYSIDYSRRIKRRDFSARIAFIAWHLREFRFTQQIRRPPASITAACAADIAVLRSRVTDVSPGIGITLPGRRILSQPQPG